MKFIFRLSTYLSIPAWLLISACTQSEAPRQEAENVKKVFPVDPLTGDWQGIRTSGNDKKPIAAQVIGYRNGTYKINLLEKFDARENMIVQLDGLKSGYQITASGTTSNIIWDGVLEMETFRGSYRGAEEGTFEMQKVVRLSPSLAAIPPKEALVLFDGTNLDQWEHERDDTGYINLDRHFGARKNSAIYLKSDVWAPNAQPVVLSLGSNDGIQAWFNGKEIIKNYISRGAAAGQEKIPIVLNEGWNMILLKVTNEGGSWGAFARILDQNDKPVETIMEKADPSSSAKSERWLKENDYFLTQWLTAGPYSEEGLDSKAIFERAFEPENNPDEAGLWSGTDFTKVDYSPKWIIKDGILQVTPGSGALVTKKLFQSYQLHLEFRSPYMPNATGQARGNSGVYNQGRYEVQILDSYGLSGEDNECGGIYKVARPRVNMCVPPMQWQSYDITFHAPRFNEQGEKIEDVKMTVNHNGVLIHEDLEIPGTTGGATDTRLHLPGPLKLQDHGDLVQFRNIWIVETIK